MSRLRNPFKVRASEKLDSDASFLKLFSPVVLDSLENIHQEDKLWGYPIFIRSSPGAGKTSLIRAFEPNSLITIQNYKSSQDYRPLFDALSKLGALNETGVETMGVSLTCARNYQLLEQLEVSDGLKNRLFFSLLNARLVIGALRSSLVLCNDTFPSGLKHISFEYENEENFFRKLDTPCSGKELFDWASNVERTIYSAIDSFLAPDENSFEGHDELFALSVITPKSLRYKNNEIAARFLFMLDDAHKLTENQRILLKKYVIDKRGDFSLWISERLEALETRENLGTFSSRDYDVVNLENFWSQKPKRFENILKSISEKRAIISTEDIDNFHEFLSDNLQEQNHRDALKRAIETSLSSIQELTNFYPKFEYWLRFGYELKGTDYEKAITLKEMEILIHRSSKRTQFSLEFALNEDEFFRARAKASGINEAARLFLSKASGIPYYFGFQTLTRLSTSNIEQFLSFSGTLFEQMISRKLKGKSIILDDTTQDRLIREVSNERWRELNRVIPYSKSVIRFLEQTGKFCQQQTYKPNAPYSPGVTGIAIKDGMTNLLTDEESWVDSDLFSPLHNVISTCVAFNLLEIRSTHQGNKGESSEVFYLNRWLCVKFDLPFSYGGFRHKSPDELIRWT